MRTINLIVVHSSATLPDPKYGVEWIRNIHVNEKGWDDIGYHYVIPPDGIVIPARSVYRAGAHAFGYNRNSIGICLIGGVDENNKAVDNYTKHQKASLITLLKVLRLQWGRDIAICGHRDLSEDVDGDGIIEQFEWMKECPCIDIPAFCRKHNIDPKWKLGSE